MSQSAKPLPRIPYSSRLKGRPILELIVIGLICYLIIAGFSGLERSLSAVRTANYGLLILALICVVLSYGMAAITYMFLTPRPLRLLPTFWVQLSGGLVNRLLPGGLGGLGINGFYLHRRGYTVTAAASIVTMNNLLGFIGNVLLVVVASVAFSFPAVTFHLPHISRVLLGIGCALVVALIVLAGSQKVLRTNLHSVWRDVLRYVVSVVCRPVRSSCALLSSCCLTCLHTTALFFVIHSMHTAVGWPIALLAISVGAFTGAIVPTPGGVGAAEAGIAGVLITFGVSSPDAVAAALLYRGLTYWLPLLPGYVALRIVEKRYI